MTTVAAGLMLCGTLSLASCHGAATEAPTKPSVESRLEALDRDTTPATGDFVGFDRNLYPGDDRLAELHKHFAFVGYWLNNPPGEKQNGWQGKRQKVRDAGSGFLVLFNGRVEAGIVKSKLSPQALGRQDAAAAVAAAQAEGFPAKTILFLDQEEGGRLTDAQSAYFFAWTEAVAASGFLPGSYLSGLPVPDGNGPDGKPATITTAQVVRETVAAKHLHPVALFVYQDSCPPAPGCTAQPPRLKDSGTLDAMVWQYAQSPRNADRTNSCAQTYSQDNLCYGGATSDLFLDLDVASSADPSHGR